MARIGFIGPTYTSQSPNADAERCVNFYMETLEASQAKSRLAMYCSPGTKSFLKLPGEPYVRGLFTQNGRCFAGGSQLYEVFADGTFDPIGNLIAGKSPVVMAATQTQMLVLASGALWLYTLATKTFVPVDMTQFVVPVATIGATDGFFIAMLQGSQLLQISNLLDGLVWNGLNIEGVSVFPDNLTSMLVDHRELWLWGQKATTVYYNTGSAYSPFSPIPGVYLETGAASTYAQCKLDNSVFWISLDDRGQGIAYRANGYAPERVSNHGVEFRWSQYATISDAIGYSYTDQGHQFWHVYFPSANASWRFDAATGVWHEVGVWNGQAYLAHNSRCHTFAFGKHLIGGALDGTIYDMNINYFTDDGTPIRRLRVSPPVSKENEQIRHRKFQLDCETGIADVNKPLVGPAPSNRGRGIQRWILSDQLNATWEVQINSDGEFQFDQYAGVGEKIYLLDTVLSNVVYQLSLDTTDPVNPSITLTVVDPSLVVLAVRQQPFVTLQGFQSYAYVENGVLSKTIPNMTRGPLVYLQTSDDGSHTWSNPQEREVGMPGDYLARVIWRRLGSSRNRTYSLTYSDPVPLRIVEADLDATPGFEPTERLTNLLGKGA